MNGSFPQLEDCIKAELIFPIKSSARTPDGVKKFKASLVHIVVKGAANVTSNDIHNQYLNVLWESQQHFLLSVYVLYSSSLHG